MTTPKIKKMLSIITDHFNDHNIPFAAIGAMALSMYGLPRYTSDIDLLTMEQHSREIVKILEKLAYNCFQINSRFAQFDSEIGVFGHVDLMFVRTKEGKEILQQSIIVTDQLMGTFPVIQPHDYIILKLMAIANNPERATGDEADIISLLKCIREGKIPDYFSLLDQKKIMEFAHKFRQTKRIQKIFNNIFPQKPKSRGTFFI